MVPGRGIHAYPSHLHESTGETAYSSASDLDLYYLIRHVYLNALGQYGSQACHWFDNFAFNMKKRKNKIGETMS